MWVRTAPPIDGGGGEAHMANVKRGSSGTAPGGADRAPSPISLKRQLIFWTGALIVFIALLWILADVLLPFYGLAASLGPIAEWGVALERHQIAADPASCETSQPGIYAIGDVAAYPGKLKLILTGFAEAARAAHSAFARCRPGEALHWEYSTTKGLPQG